MSKRNEASPKTKTVIWAKSAGRCYYPGCNELLWEDLLSGKEDGNFGFIAHVIAAQSSGPRGDTRLSPKLANDVSNLMLLCYRHHHLIDVEEVELHTVDRLQAIKKKHEDRIHHQSSLQEDYSTSVLLFGANIGEQNSLISFSEAKDAILPDRYPEGEPPIELGMVNTAFQDHEEDYWNFQQANLRKLFDQNAKPRLLASSASNIAVFALAPQPLLIQLGQLLSDIPKAEVFQRHREPATWQWLDSKAIFNFQISKQINSKSNVALKISISATINDERIHEVLGKDVSIWSLTIPSPHNDCLENQNQLSEFRKVMRHLFNQIKSIHGERVNLNIFPAIPVACAVELGRVWMPKADLPLIIYDQIRKRDGFIRTISIN